MSVNENMNIAIEAIALHFEIPVGFIEEYFDAR
jgi:hypothetical protein